MKVFFAVASYLGLKRRECVPFIDSLNATLALLMERGHDAALAIEDHNCYVQVARNDLAEAFYTSDCDVLFFLDDDLRWNPRDVLRVLETDGEIVAGVYPKKTADEDYPVVIRTRQSHRPMVRGDGALAAELVPTGFLKVTRAVIETLRAAYPEQRYWNYANGKRTDAVYDLFPQGVRDGRWWGEDFAFSHLWRALGGEIWVVPDITFDHIGQDTAWRGNYHEFLLRQPGGSGAPDILIPAHDSRLTTGN